MSSITITDKLVVMSCWCGIHHAVPEKLRDSQLRCHRDGRAVPDIYCPLGHTHVPSGKGEAQELRERLERERARAARLASERDQFQASLTAQKGVTTKLKKRIANGVCPVCRRSFQNVHRHMCSQHPDFIEEESK